MRDNAVQQKIWKLERNLFALKEVLNSYEVQPFGYEGRLNRRDVYQNLHDCHKKLAELVVSHPVKPPHNNLEQWPLFESVDLVEVTKKKRKRLAKT